MTNEVHPQRIQTIDFKSWYAAFIAKKNDDTESNDSFCTASSSSYTTAPIYSSRSPVTAHSGDRIRNNPSEIELFSKTASKPEAHEVTDGHELPSFNEEPPAESQMADDTLQEGDFSFDLLFPQINSLPAWQNIYDRNRCVKLFESSATSAHIPIPARK